MAEFYVTFDRDGQHCVGLIFAPEVPASLQFADYESVQAALDALGNPWELRCEINDPHEYASEASAAWLKQLNETKALKREPKPENYLFSGGTPDGMYGDLAGG